MRITVQAHAKINLHLQILDRRDNGYHDVVTVLQSLALHDTLTCESRPGPFVLHCDRAGVPLDESNLVWRAARLLAEHAGRPAPADTVVTIDKQIPMQAGLGGGSADAATALVALARLWDVTIDRAALLSLASRLGADVPFCVEGGTALGRGRGDELQALPDLPPHAALVVMPPFGVSTPDAYRWHDERVATGSVADATAEAVATWPDTSDAWPARLPSLFNDFEIVVGARFPDVPETVATLRRARARWAAMSGSGAAIVGLFASDAEAAAAASHFQRPAWRTFVTRTSPRHSADARTRYYE